MQTKNVRIEKVADGVSYEWDIYESFLEDLQQIKEQDRYFYDRCSKTHVYDTMSWYGTPDGFDGVIRRVEHGWPELREQLVKMMAGLDLDLPVFPSMTTARRRKRVRRDTGDTLDMTRVWGGDLDHAWEKPVRTERLQPNTKRITLAFDVTANAFVNNDMAMWRAALCTVLCDSLARAGRIFEIWVIDSTASPFQGYHGTPRNLWSAWCVKKTQDPLVLDRLCGMVSVGFMRSSGFVAMGCGPWKAKTGFGGALGSGLPKTLLDRRNEGEVVLRIGQCYSRDEVIREYRSAWEEIEEHAAEAARHDAA